MLGRSKPLLIVKVASTPDEDLAPTNSGIWLSDRKLFPGQLAVLSTGSCPSCPSHLWRTRRNLNKPGIPRDFINHRLSSTRIVRGTSFRQGATVIRIHSERRDRQISTALAVTVGAPRPSSVLRVAQPAAAQSPPASPAVSGAGKPGNLRDRSSTGGRVLDSIPTASHDPTSPQSPNTTPVAPSADASAHARFETISIQPIYPGPASIEDLVEPPSTTAAAHPPSGVSPTHTHRVGRSNNRLRHQDQPQEPLNPSRIQDQRRLHSPFRNRATSASPHRLRRPAAARLWNPTNSTPRLPKTVIRKRRPSTPPLPAVPLFHPTFVGTDTSDPIGTGAGDYPLLSLPEQRQTKHPTPSRASLQIDHAGLIERRISLPRSVRHSYDEKRSTNVTPTPTEPFQEAIQEQEITPKKVDKGKGREIMASENSEAPVVRDFSKDLERGPDIMDPRLSNVSGRNGIGSPILSDSSDSSIMGEDVQGDAGHEWGPQHPCYPHLNPHVPPNSPEYNGTRIIRVRRDFMIKGDIAPTFSNTYPDILDPVGLTELEFRRVIEKLNKDLVEIHNPYSLRNIIDGTLGLLTGWLWDDFGLTGVKSRLNHLERWIERWNKEMEKTLGVEDGMIAPKIISLRKTGYMTLDIQIPDPEIAPAPSTPRSVTVFPQDPDAPPVDATA